MTKDPTPWKAGQEVFLRDHVVTIDRVTPTGIAVIGTERFDQHGYLQGEDKKRRRERYYRPRTTIQAATPEAKKEWQEKRDYEALHTEAWSALDKLHVRIRNRQLTADEMRAIVTALAPFRPGEAA